MISVEEARNLILENTMPLTPLAVNLADSLGSILADNVISPIDLPPFDQSAMDGFAIAFSDYGTKENIEVVGEVAAGNVFQGKILPGQAVRIFTGASVPIGVDTVVTQEKVNVEKGRLIINDVSLKQGANVRGAGSQIKKNRIALSKGTIITPGAIGYLAAMGIVTVNVVARPRITVVVTGSELKKPGTSLDVGQIYESNSYAIVAALESIGQQAHKIIWLPDNEAETISVLTEAIKNSDLVLITGGISVGEYDFVGRALQQIRVKNIFYKIKQKPGKPLFFGKNKQAVIFGLPGNPAAVLSCFYEYVYPAINCMMGNMNTFLKKYQLPIAVDYPKKAGLSFFLKGKVTGNSVVPLDGQESYILSSFATADCLIYLPAGSENVKAGEIVEVHPLPGLY